MFDVEVGETILIGYGCLTRSVSLGLYTFTVEQVVESVGIDNDVAKRALDE